MDTKALIQPGFSADLLLNDSESTDPFKALVYLFLPDFNAEHLADLKKIFLNLKKQEVTAEIQGAIIASLSQAENISLTNDAICFFYTISKWQTQELETRFFILATDRAQNIPTGIDELKLELVN